MNKSYTFPFLFPTTVVFVDDCHDFLTNLSLQLEPMLAFRLFQSPNDALIAIDSNGAKSRSTVSKFLSLYQQYDEIDRGHQVIAISLDMIHRNVHNEQRFDEISVVVVDYDMPQMNGLEFCRRLQNPLIRKILLTGKADERIAVEAFNQGLIDRFIRKQEADSIETLNLAIRELQPRYFDQVQSMLCSSLSVGSPRFLQDQKIAARFRNLCSVLNIVEYYLTCEPDGILMLDATGTSYLLIIQNEDQFQSMHEIAYDQGAPDELLKLLRSGEVLPYFWKTQGIYSPMCEDWRNYLHPATRVEGSQWYAYTVVKEPDGFNLKHVVCYAKYLERLDARTLDSK